MPPARAVTAALATTALGAAAWAALVEPRAFVLRRHTVPVLPPGSPPVRVLHLSDVHLVPGQEAKVAWIRSLAALRPDLVVHTGDNLAHHRAVPHVLRAYEGLLDVPGVFVLGSNDYFPPTPKNPLRYFNDSHRRGEALTAERLPTQDLVDALTSRGWTDLDNARAELTVRGVAFELVGVDDPHLGYDRLPAPRLAAPDAVRLGVAHAPYRRVLDAMATDGARLLLAGHTHGGQLRVPFVGALVTNCDLDTGRARGLSRWWPETCR